MNKKTLTKSIIYPLILTTALSAMSNWKKDGRYNFGYNKSIISSTSFEDSSYYNDDYALQGGCTDGKYKFLTAYDTTGKKNSIILLLDENSSIIKTIDLNTKSHVGGIARDYDHNIIWITDINGTVTAFKIEDIINNNTITPIYNQIDISQGELLKDDGTPSVACLTYEQGNLYASSYSKWNKAKLKTIPVNENGSLNTDNTKTVDFINYAQGLQFVVKNNNVYLIVSTSHGITYDSILKFYKYDENITDYKQQTYKFYRMPPMSEGLFFDENNNINIINESNAKKYDLIADYFYNDVDDLTTLHTDTLTKSYKYW